MRATVISLAGAAGTRPGCGAPTRAGARCTSRGCCASSGSRSSTSSRGRSLVLPCSTASMAGLASGSIFTNHCVDSIGSTTVSQRWQWPTACTCGFEPRSRPSSFRRALTALRAAKRSSPANGPALGGDHARLVEDRDHGQVVALAGLEVVGVVGGRHLHRAGAELRVDQDRVGDDRELPVTSGCLSILPIFAWWRGSSGWTATAVSPSIVSGRVVATTTSPEPSTSG